MDNPNSQQGARDRLFYSLPDHKNSEIPSDPNHDKESLIQYISSNILGKDKIFSGPFGLRRVTYLDYIASGRALRFIEDYIQNEVLPDYGNTHTTTSITSLQTTLYRHEARDIVRNSVHASEHDSVIFVGSGSTAAVHKLIHGLDLQEPPTVFVGPYEHHSSFLPWAEVGAKIIRIKTNQTGSISITDMQDKLKRWQGSGRQLIGCFSASSNITGILVDVDQVTVCLHRAGALAFWDYATAAPYVKIDMNPVVTNSEDQPYVYKDAVFISPHKFIGGVQTPGLLIAKKKMFRNSVPEKCGGGSVFYVRREGHRFLQEPELREEGGTPAIVEAIRTGMVFQLKNEVTPEFIMKKEHDLFIAARDTWKDCQNLILLGNLSLERLPVFSFLVYQSQCGRFLHHNFVASLLNDLFGIQARGGCACAGPYAMDVLGLDERTAKEIEELLAEDNRLDRTHLRRYREYSHREIIRPGFVRINLPYFMDQKTLEFVTEAIKLVAEEGWKLLPQYMFNPETGEWRQRNFQVFKDRKWLGHIKYSTGKMQYKVPPFIVKGELPNDFQDCLEKAKSVVKQAEKTKYHLPDHTQMFDEKSKQYRWFLLPSEAAACLHGNHVESFSSNLPFCPPGFREKIGLPPMPESFEEEDVVFEGKVQRSNEVLNGINEENNIEQKTDFSVRMISSMDEGFEECKAESEESVCNVSTPGNNIIDSHTDHSKTVTCSKSSNTQLNTELASLKNERGVKCSYKRETTYSNAQDSKSKSDTGPCSSSLNSVSDNDSTTEDTKESKLKSLLKETKKRHVDSDCFQDRTNVCTLSKKRKTEAIPVAENLCQSTDCDNKNMKSEAGKSKKSCKWFSPPKSIFTPFLKAMEDYGMIKTGDKVLVCLSGGKDSLSLLHTIRQYQFYSRSKGIQFEFGAVTVDPQTPSYDPSPLKQYLASLGVPYFYEAQCIMEQAQSLEECASICSFCSRMKRGRIYACARRNGYNVLALGQHLDDLSESFLMSFFHNGILRTMKAHYSVEENDLRVIRPFVYVREKDLRTFAEKNKLPVIAENCPACFEAPKERHRTKQLLASQEILFPHLYHSMMAAMKPIMGISQTGVKVKDILSNGQRNEVKDDVEDMDI